MKKGRFYFLESTVNNRVLPYWARRGKPESSAKSTPRSNKSIVRCTSLHGLTDKEIQTLEEGL